MLTIKEAWLKCADVWRNARERLDYVVVDINGFESQGLCTTISKLVNTYKIRSYVAKEMELAIKPLPNDHLGYCWPRNIEGAAQRVDFCLQQAEKCP